MRVRESCSPDLIRKEMERVREQAQAAVKRSLELLKKPVYPF
jgi:hypothetical protein